MDDELFTQTVKPFTAHFSHLANSQNYVKLLNGPTQYRHLGVCGYGFGYETKKSTKLRKGTSHGPNIFYSELHNCHEGAFQGIDNMGLIFVKDSFAENHESSEKDLQQKNKAIDDVFNNLGKDKHKGFIVGGSSVLSRQLSFKNQRFIIVSPYSIVSTKNLKENGQSALYFGGQGDEFRMEDDFPEDTITWLEKDIRQYKQGETKGIAKTQAGALFEKLYSEAILSKEERGVSVIFNLNSVEGHVTPGTSYPSCAGGLSAEEVYEIAYLCGLNGKIEMFEVTEYIPSVEKHKTAAVLIKMLYEFSRGFCDLINERVMK